MPVLDFRFHPESPVKYVSRKILQLFEMVDVENGSGYFVGLSPSRPLKNPAKAILTHYEHPMYPAARGESLPKAKDALIEKMVKIKMLSINDYADGIRFMNEHGYHCFSGMTNAHELDAEGDEFEKRTKGLPFIHYVTVKESGSTIVPYMAMTSLIDSTTLDEATIRLMSADDVYPLAMGMTYMQARSALYEKLNRLVITDYKAFSRSMFSACLRKKLIVPAGVQLLQPA